jgi:hypothetical protein
MGYTVYSNEWRDGIYTAMSGRDGIYTAMSGRDGIYTATSGRDLRMGEWDNRGQWNMEDGRRRQTF